ncbi:MULTISPECIES: phosphoribosylglycinamide formyltransferase [unclassified Gemella]|uniref:phosphoribosylglycinamide formyltransferase n=1 Tax=unclassified Gemella TaxID=2624949 RepID=UPI001073255B|nr:MULTISPECIES: phosphoribosylglycinamide formyltransferase [unclassified Gemella]MBF0710527.1 phosphoribosylglycinamide formyltransferase [Gemella sp. GL1.1]MBF0747204.1 phosphoribosylglycinamide formyltransferase [Gemella sp. 19428wG2_WT2a]NYS27871.1 phosphoribosylglycinamide formyltransferase [Gemella sp. GL1]TFU58000.1 phosphoribosylglycinamide formyltransferase [Gemella sp. WT2a]
MVSKIAVFASGSGSNFEAIAQAVQDGRIQNAEISLLVTDKDQVYALERAKKFDIETKTFLLKNFEDKIAYEKAILEVLSEKEIDFIVLAGYMKLIGESLLSEYEGRMINIHPSILPAFKGKDAIAMALEYGVRYTGVSIHWVDSGMDTGKIIEQDVVRVDKDDTYQTLAEKIHKVEHVLYPKVINEILNK